MKIGTTETTKTTETKEKKVYEVIPKGLYHASLQFVQEVKTKDGTGSYIKATFKVENSPVNSRYVFHNFNIKNKSDRAQEIGIDQLNRYFKCVGSNLEYVDGFKLEDLMTTLKQPLGIKLAIEEASGKWKARNKITSFAKV